MIPKWLAMLERLCLRPADRETVGGDLREEYLRERPGGPARAATRYVIDLMSARTRRFSAVRHRAASDLSYTCRALADRPAFTLAVVATIAVGLGATMAIMRVAEAVLVTPLPYPDASRLMFVSSSFPGSTGGGDQLSVLDIKEIRDRTKVLESVAGYYTGRSLQFIRPGSGEPSRVSASLVDPGYLELLGAAAARGRLLGAQDAVVRDGHPVAVVTYRFWTDELGGDPGAVGRALVFSDVALTVVGVLSPEFRDVTAEDSSASEVFVPLSMAPSFGAGALLDNRGSRNLWALARLDDSVTSEQAFGEITDVASQLSREHNANRGFTFWIEPLNDRLIGEVRGTLWLLLAGSLFVLITAGVNAANLQLTRLHARVQELVVRRALGASRRQLAGLVVLESFVLVGLGGVVAVPAGYLGSVALASLVPGDLTHRLDAAGVGLTTFAASAAVILGVAAALGLACGWHVFRLVASHPASFEPRGAGGTARTRFRSVLVGVEVAMATVLLVGAVLMATSLKQLRGANPGFNADRILTASIDLGSARYRENTSAVAFGRKLMEELAPAPGVESVFLWGPARPGRQTWVTFPGRVDVAPSAERLMVTRHTISPGALSALEIPLRAGREFSWADNADTSPVVIVSETLATLLWPSQDPVGQRMRWRTDLPDAPIMTVVGVAADARHRGRMSLSPARDVYVPVSQRPDRRMLLLVRTAGEPTSVVTDVRSAVGRVDPVLPLGSVATLRALMADEEAETRFAATLMVIFGLVAALLAWIGIHGVISQTVRLRSREVAIRLALGARPVDVVRGVAAGGLTPTITGLIAGLVGSALLAPTIRTLLFEITPLDLRVYALVAAGVALAAVVATLFPAQKAARIDPAVTLKS